MNKLNDELLEFEKDSFEDVQKASQEIVPKQKVELTLEEVAVLDRKYTVLEPAEQKHEEVAAIETAKDITSELKKFGVNMEALKANDYKFGKEVLSKEKEPTVNALREKLGNSVRRMLDGLEKIDKEKVIMVSVIVGTLSAMIPVMGISDLQTMISVLPDSLVNLLKNPELAGSPIWSIISPGGDSFSMPSMENYTHQVDMFNSKIDISNVTEGNPFGASVDVSDPGVIAQKLKHGIAEQNLHRMGSAFGNLASTFVIVPSMMLVGKTFGKIGKYFINKK